MEWKLDSVYFSAFFLSLFRSWVCEIVESVHVYESGQVSYPYLDSRLYWAFGFQARGREVKILYGSHLFGLLNITLNSYQLTCPEYEDLLFSASIRRDDKV